MTHRWLYPSLGLNLALAAVAGLVLVTNPPQPVAAPVQPLPIGPVPKPATARGAAASPAARPFHWSQVESEDYATFVTNLRAIGCPEATIRDIVSAEVREIYQEKRRTVAASMPYGTGRRTMEAAYAKLAQEETAVVAEVFGANPATADKQASATRAPGANPARVSAPRVFYPTVFQYPAAVLSSAAQAGPSAAPGNRVARGAAAAPATILTPSQAEAVQQLQEKFVQDVGGPNQNPADPSYLKRWQTAQQESDDTLRAQIGWSAFNDYQVAQAQQAEAANPNAK